MLDFKKIKTYVEKNTSDENDNVAGMVLLKKGNPARGPKQGVRGGVYVNVVSKNIYVRIFFGSRLTLLNEYAWIFLNKKKRLK